MITRVIYLNISSEAKPRIFQVTERDGNAVACRFWDKPQAIVIMYILSIVGINLLNNRRIIAIIVIICGPTAGPASSYEFVLYWFDLFEKPCFFQRGIIVNYRESDRKHFDRRVFSCSYVVKSLKSFV